MLFPCEVQYETEFESVVTETTLLEDETFPEASLAFTEKVYAVEAVKPVMFAVVPVTFPNKLEPTNGNFVQRHAEAVSLLHDVEVLHAIGDFNQKEKFVFDDEMINGIRTLIVYYKNSKNPLQNFLRRMKAYQLGFKKMQKPDLVHGNVLHNNMGKLSSQFYRISKI